MSTPKKQLEADIESARGWLVDVARGCYRLMEQRQGQADRMARAVEVVCACAALPGDMPLRMRCTPGVFGFKA